MKNDLNQIAQQIGYKGIISKPELIDFLTSKCNELALQIQFFETKYKNTLSYLQNNFHQITDYSIIEKEDDEMKWEAYTDFHAEYLQIINQLENGNASE